LIAGARKPVVAAVVVTVSVEVTAPLPLGVNDVGFRLHPGASAGDGATEQVSVMAELKPPTGVIETVAVAWPPAATEGAERVPVEGRVKETAVPVPVRATVCWPAESVMTKLAESDPVAAGLNVTSIAHPAPAARDESHLFEEIAKSLASVPEMATLEIERLVRFALFVKVAVNAELVDPTP